MSGWTQKQAVEFCRTIEDFAPRYGCHVALTGGTLYREGERKDADLILYRIRQIPKIDVDGLVSALQSIGVEFHQTVGWCFKATFEDRSIDFLFPEHADSEGAGYKQENKSA